MGRKQYKKSFKIMIVDLLNNGHTGKQIFDQYGLNESMVYRWRKEFSNKSRKSFTGNGNMSLTDDKKRIRDLEKQLKDACIERDILKKAVSIFCVSDSRNMNS